MTLEATAKECAANAVAPRVSLADRLKVDPGSSGFSERHVVSEIDGATPPPPNSDSGNGQPPAPNTAPQDASGPTASQAQPASGTSPHPPRPDAGTNMESAADTQTETADEGEQAGAAGTPAHDASGASLPPDWPKQYAAALRRAQRPGSLSKYAAQFWATMPLNWEQVKATEDRVHAEAIYDAFATIRDPGERDLQLRELGAL